MVVISEKSYLSSTLRILFVKTFLHLYKVLYGKGFLMFNLPIFQQTNRFGLEGWFSNNNALHGSKANLGQHAFYFLPDRYGCSAVVGKVYYLKVRHSVKVHSHHIVNLFVSSQLGR